MKKENLTNKQTKQFTTKKLVLSALFAALIFTTTYMFKIPSPLGYVHLGDAFIYLAGAILPLPFAIASSTIGAALSDGLGGYFIYILPSVIIKAMTALCFTNKTIKIITKRNLLAIIPSFFLCVGGYYIFEVIIQQNFVSPLSSIIGNIGQVLISGLLFILIGLSLDKIKFKNIIRL
ncbi:MAG: TIGR04002 family protein [Clostridia bacterium]